MDFEDFEGFKRIKNVKKMNIQEIISILRNYEKETGKIVHDVENDIIIIESDQNYSIELKIKDNEIIIERKNKTEKEQEINDLQQFRTDRMIEQIYDLLNDYIKNGTIKEHITSTKKFFTMTEGKRSMLKGIISLGNFFKVKDTNNNILYEIVQNKLNKIYSIRKVEYGTEICALKYENMMNEEFIIEKPPFENIVIKLDKSAVKTIFRGWVTPKKELKISADYTDNHYLVELDEIVIGAIDCLDPDIKQEYTLEINNLDYEDYVIATAVMLDVFECYKKNYNIE